MSFKSKVILGTKVISFALLVLACYISYFEGNFSRAMFLGNFGACLAILVR